MPPAAGGIKTEIVRKQLSIVQRRNTFQKIKNPFALSFDLE